MAATAIATAFALVLFTVVASPLAAQQDPVSFSPRTLDFSRNNMVEVEVRRRGVSEPRVLAAMKEVPRHLFVPESQREHAYDGSQVLFAPGQTLSQPYLSGRMIELLELDGSERVLEIGTGSGYDAALVSRLAREVYTIEINDRLGQQARSTLRDLGYDNVTVRIGDGYRGWPEEAPFDAILLTTSPRVIPEPLFDQLKVGGKMVVAIGASVVQELQVITKRADGKEVRRFDPVRLGEMTGEAQNR